MYKGSLKYNLDPTEQVPKQEILKLLKKANLHEIILKKVREDKEKKKDDGMVNDKQ